MDKSFGFDNSILLRVNILLEATMYTCVSNWEQQVFHATSTDLEIIYSSRL